MISDIFHTALNWISHNRYLALGAAAFIGLNVYGCSQPTITSPYSEKPVTAEVLANEFNKSIKEHEATYNANLALIDAKIKENQGLLATAKDEQENTDALFKQLEKLQQDRLALVNGIVGAATPYLGPTVAPVVTQLLPLGLGALGLGAVVDNRRKDRVILNLKTGAAANG